MTDAPNLLSREAFDADAYLRCDCHERVNQTCDKRAIRTHIAALEAERDAAIAALSWVTEVSPDSLPWGGAAVEITWGQFNEMRRCCGARPLKPAKPMELRDAAYRRGLEDAAKVADQHAAVQWSEGGHYQRDDYQRGKREHAGHAITHVAAAIRALKPGEAE